MVVNHGQYIAESDRVDEVSEFLWYRYFEQNFEITSRIIVSYSADLQIPSAGMFDLQQKLIQELSDVAVAAARIQNGYLAQRLSKMVIEVGLEFEDRQLARKQLISGLAEIRSTNNCGKAAVQNALLELQTSTEMNKEDSGIPVTTPLILNFIGYTFEDQEEFIKAVGRVEDELNSSKNH